MLGSNLVMKAFMLKLNVRCLKLPRAAEVGAASQPYDVAVHLLFLRTNKSHHLLMPPFTAHGSHLSRNST